MLGALLIAGACREEPTPEYLRLQGPSPEVPDLPKAKAHLLVFWASWCPPCRAETPQLQALAADPPDGVSVVVMSQDDEYADVEKFFGGNPAPALHLRIDPGGTVADLFAVEVLPTSILIANGRRAARFEGPRDWDGRPMRRLLERLAGEATSSR